MTDDLAEPIDAARPAAALLADLERLALDLLSAAQLFGETAVHFGNLAASFAEQVHVAKAVADASASSKQ